MRPLYKTTIIIWSDEDPYGYELEELGREATSGSMYCSSIERKLVKHPEKDKAWDGTEFFNEE